MIVVVAGVSRARSRSVPDPAERTRLAAHVGGLLRRERVARGWSQRRLEAAAGLSRGYVGYLESGAERLSTSTTRRLAEALRPDGTPVDVAVLAEMELLAQVRALVVAARCAGEKYGAACTVYETDDHEASHQVLWDRDDTARALADELWPLFELFAVPTGPADSPEAPSARDDQHAVEKDQAIP